MISTDRRASIEPLRAELLGKLRRGLQHDSDARHPVRSQTHRPTLAETSVESPRVSAAASVACLGMCEWDGVLKFGSRPTVNLSAFRFTNPLPGR